MNRVLAAVALVLAAACAQAPDTVAERASGQPPATVTERPSGQASAAAAAPVAALDFTADLVDGGQLAGGDLEGRDVVLWLWAPW